MLPADSVGHHLYRLLPGRADCLQPEGQLEVFAHNARHLIRSANMSWMLTSRSDERLVTAHEMRKRFRGVIYVGDSQVREVAWAAMQHLTSGETLELSRSDSVFGTLKASVVRDACPPMDLVKGGFTAMCSGSGTCVLRSPLHNVSRKEIVRRIVKPSNPAKLADPALTMADLRWEWASSYRGWDGTVALPSTICSSQFFVSYQVMVGATPINPSLPACLGHGRPTLWVVSSSALHELREVLSSHGVQVTGRAAESVSRRTGRAATPAASTKPSTHHGADDGVESGAWLASLEHRLHGLGATLASTVLSRFPPSVRQSGHVIYQSAGGGFAMLSHARHNLLSGQHHGLQRGSRPEGMGAWDASVQRAHRLAERLTSAHVRSDESRWLLAEGVRGYVDYAQLALDFAPLMSDGVHFAYQYAACASTFPEMALLVAQLGFQHAVGRPVQYCPVADAAVAGARDQSRARGQSRQRTEWHRDERPAATAPPALAMSRGPGHVQSSSYLPRSLHLMVPPSAEAAALASAAMAAAASAAVADPNTCRAQLVMQTSAAKCQLGVSFGCHDATLFNGSRVRKLWVRNCRGIFTCDHVVVQCGYPPGSSSYSCSCGWDERRPCTLPSQN